MNAAPRDLDGLRFALVGAGAVGGALAGWLAARGARLVAVAGRDPAGRAGPLAARLGARPETLASLASDDSDLLLLAVPDDQLAEVAAELARRPQARVALHVAGALGAEVLAPLAEARVATGTFHPLRAFAGLDPAAEPPRGIFFALDGAPAALACGRRLAAALGGDCGVVSGAARPIYHLAATLVAGGITTIVAVAHEVRRRAGIPAAADAGYARLAEDALAAALAADDPARGITGPAARGDLDTFTLEARALSRVAPEALAVVVALGRESLRQRARTAPSSAAQRRLAEALEHSDLLDLARDRVLTSPREPHG